MPNENLDKLDNDYEDSDGFVDDANLEDEGLDDSAADDDIDDTTDDESVSSSEDGDDEDASGEDDSTDDPKATKKQPLFDKKQQAELDKIVTTRLARQNEKLVRDLSAAAGVDISHEEVTSASRLWGLLKANPELSKSVDGIIAEALSKGTAKAPESKTSDDASKRVAFKEAVLDLRASDVMFNKNSQKILAWAETEGYEVSDAKTLKLAYLAWKSTQGKVTEAAQKAATQRKQAEKKAMQKKATVQSAKSTAGVHKSALDYRKMSDADVLKAEGKSLFIDD
jgi:hypothetical protein